MGNILTATVKIKGVRPLLWHRFGPDSIPLEKGEKVGVAGNNPSEYLQTVLHTKEGQLYVEPSYIFGCVRDGSRNIKKGRGSIQPAMASTLQVLDSRVLINRWLPKGWDDWKNNGLTQDPDSDVYLDVRSVRNPATKGRNVRYRIAANHGWETEFRLQWDKTIVSRGELEAAVIDAGRLCGLGDGRSVGFGRFDVTSFEVEG